MEAPSGAATSGSVMNSRPREWDEVLGKITQPPSPPAAVSVPRSPHGKNRAKSKAPNHQSQASTGPAGVDLTWALDLLEPIQLPNNLIQKEEAGVMLHGICQFRQGDILSINRLCQYFVKFCTHQAVSFTPSQLDGTLTYFANLVRTQKDMLLLKELLRALGYICFENGSRTKHLPALFDLLVPLCSRQPTPGFDREIQRLALICIGNLCMKTSPAKLATHSAALYDLLLATIHLQPPLVAQPNPGSTSALSSPAVAKVLAAALRATQLLLTELAAAPKSSSPLFVQQSLPSLIPQLKLLSFFGTSVNPVPQIEASTSASTNSSGAANCNIGSKRTVTRDRSGESDSDSNTSDVDQIRDVERSSWKVRFRAISCLQALVRFNARLFYNHWSLFLPSSAAIQQQQQMGVVVSSPVQSASIFTLLKVDPIVKVRAAALTFLAAILDGSKPFWLAADEVKSTASTSQNTSSSSSTATKKGSSATPFISFSATLVSMVKDTHYALGQYLTTETVVPCVTLALKALASLFSNAPYERLAPGLASSTVSLLLSVPANASPSSSLLDSAHMTVRLATLSTLSALFASHGALPDLKALLFPAENDQEKTNEKLPSSFLSRLKALSSDVTSAHLRAEAIACLAALSKPYFSHVQSQWSSLFQSLLLPALLHDTDSQVRCSAAKVVEDYTAAAANASTLSSATSTTTAAESLQMWRGILESKFTTALEDQNAHPVRASICTTFSHIPAAVFAQLPNSSRIQCITLTLAAAANDSIPAVRAAACRTLGVYVLFPILRQDTLFLGDVLLQLLRNIDDSNLNVRIRSVWSLANMCDALVVEQHERLLAHQNDTQAKENEDYSPAGGIEDDLPPHLLPDLLSAFLRLCNDHDKVRCNAVRALGNFCRFASAPLLSPQLNAIVSILLGNLTQGSVKVRWNSAYAIGNVLRNTSVVSRSALSWRSTLIDALLETVRDCKNFKVRINATQSLACVSTRSLFPDDQFAKMWSVLLNALSTIDSVSDVTEFRYKQTLTQQIIQTLLHAIDLCEPTTDGALLKDVLSQSGKVLVAAFEREEFKPTKTNSATTTASQLTNNNAAADDENDEIATPSTPLRSVAAAWPKITALLHSAGLAHLLPPEKLATAGETKK